MDEQLQSESVEQVSPTVDLTELETKLTDLVEVLETEQEEKKVEAEKLAKEEKQQAVEAEKQLKDEQLKTAEEAKLQAETIEKEQELMQSLVTTVDEMVVANEGYQTEIKELMEKQHENVIEGFYFVGLSIIISFAVHMFWNQLSKW